MLGEDVLCNSIYANPAEFRDHFGSRGKPYGSYFSDMIKEAVSQSRDGYPALLRDMKRDIKKREQAATCRLRAMPEART